MEENRRFSWSDLFIKAILVIIFVLFTVWLLSLSNKGVSNSLNVLTDNIFEENIERMKEVGKEYFTIERLPEKVGDIKTLTLEKMYDKKLILEVKDKFGNACSAKNSYVSIEKFDTEYQMKVYLECGEESDYIIVIMGCYDYCDTDICEKKATDSKQVEYEYKKTTGGYWTNYGAWSEWSKVGVTGTDYRQVETKVEDEKYTYDKTVTETLYEKFETSCPKGYKKTTDGTKCYKENTTYDYKEPVCSDRSKEGFKLVSQNGFACTYSKNVSSTANPNKCASAYDGYTLVSQNGFTCNYSKDVKTSYQVPVSKPKYCYRQELVPSCPKGGMCTTVIKNIKYQCGTKTEYETKYTTKTQTTTTTVSCPEGYTKSENSCVKTTYVDETKNAMCPEGYTKTNDSKCSKAVTNYSYKDIVKSCPAGYEKTKDNTKCFKNVDSIVKVEGTRKVTYYRYRVREFIGGNTDYKWSTSKEDKELLNAGYVLTGKTR